MKQAANDKFARKLYEKAAALYDDAIAVLPPRRVVEASSGGDEEADGVAHPDKGKAKEVDSAPEENEEEQEVRQLRRRNQRDMLPQIWTMSQNRNRKLNCVLALFSRLRSLMRLTSTSLSMNTNTSTKVKVQRAH